MKHVTIYTTPVCPYCIKAKKLLEQKGVPFDEIDVSNEEARETMIRRSGGRRTVPQIFIEGFHVGGCDDLYAFEREGKLDGILQDKATT